MNIMTIIKCKVNVNRIAADVKSHDAIEILVDQKMSSSRSSNSAGNIWFISCPLSEVSSMNYSKDPSSGDVRKATSWGNLGSRSLDRSRSNCLHSSYCLQTLERNFTFIFASKFILFYENICFKKMTV